ncbi:MAG: hypothetical protein EOL88_12565 [Bacteroidia bacterium]|nr:hypothetical protein [Bacteroidia bacterium]
MKPLPDWVLKYKKKGIYVKKTKTGYALYRGHSQRVPEKSYPVFKCDEYLGIVTETDGLILSKPPVKPGIKVFRYGFCRIAEVLCSVLRINPQKRGMNADILFVKAVLGYEGMESQMGYEGSWLSIVFPNLNLDKKLSEEEEYFLPTLRRQVRSKIEDGLGVEREEIIALSANLYAVYVNGSWHLSELFERLKSLATKKSISFEIGGKYNGV